MTVKMSYTQARVLDAVIKSGNFGYEQTPSEAATLDALHRHGMVTLHVTSQPHARRWEATDKGRKLRNYPPTSRDKATT